MMPCMGSTANTDIGTRRTVEQQQALKPLGLGPLRPPCLDSALQPLQDARREALAGVLKRDLPCQIGVHYSFSGTESALEGVESRWEKPSRSTTRSLPDDRKTSAKHRKKMKGPR